MKVLMVGSIDPYRPVVSGVASYMMNLILYLRDRDVDITFLGVSYEGKRKKSSKNSFTFVPIAKGNRLSRSGFLAKLMTSVPKLKLTGDTIIHCHRPDDMFPFVLYCKKSPTVCTLHGHFKHVHAYRGRIVGKTYDAIERFTLKRVDRLIAVSDEIRDFYASRYPWADRKMCVIPVGVDTRRFRPLNKLQMKRRHGFEPEDRLIIYVGRLEKEKMLDVLIRAFNEISVDVNHAKLVLVGEGRERERLRALVNFLGAKNVIFKGVVEHDYIPQILNCADAFVLCSRYEGLPTALLEALACGIPVVSTDVGDVPAIIENGRNGYIVKSSRELKEKLRIILKGDKDYKKEGVDTAADYSWDRIGGRVLEVYSELVE